MPRWGDEMTMCESDKVRKYAADNAGASTLSHTDYAVGVNGSMSLAGLIKKSGGGGRRGECDQW